MIPGRIHNEDGALGAHNVLKIQGKTTQKSTSKQKSKVKIKKNQKITPKQKNTCNQRIQMVE